MGEDVADNQRGVTGEYGIKETLATALRAVRLDDTKLLADLIYHYAGPDLQAHHQNLEAEVIKIRRPLLKQMMEIQAAAKNVLGTPREFREVDALEHAAADLIGGSEAYAHIETARRYLGLLSEIADIPVVLNLEAFAQKSELDATTSRVVLAVARYCFEMDIPFKGEPRRQEASNKSVHITKSAAARLVAEVLTAMKLEFTPAQLSTHMKKAQTAFGA